MVKLLRRGWIPLLIVVVVALAAFGVFRLHGVFGKTELTRPGFFADRRPHPPHYHSLP
jgi:hypothetical protein